MRSSRGSGFSHEDEARPFYSRLVGVGHARDSLLIAGMARSYRIGGFRR